MKRFALSALLSLAVVASAAAQTSSPSTSTTSSGTADQSTATSSTSTSSDQSAGATGTTAPVSKEASKTESGKKAKLTGCIESQGSSYALVDKKHPNGVQLLSSDDLSAHVGHKVEVKGTWEAASMTGSTASPSNPSGVSTSNTGAGATSAQTSKPENNPYNTPVGNNTGTADMTPVGGKTDNSGSGSGNASALPQSDQSVNQAIRVSEIKMKSDKCENNK